MSVKESVTPGPTAIAPVRRRLRKAEAIPLVSVVVFLAAWQFGASFANPILLPSPTAVVAGFIDLSLSGALGEAVLVSLVDLSVGFLVGAVVGIVVGTLIGRFPSFEKVMSPYVSFFMATPGIALVPLVIIWFGFGMGARIFLILFICVWPIIVNTAEGVKSHDRVLREVSRSFGLSNMQYLRWIALPGAVPSIFSGLRIGLGQAIIGMIVAQMTMELSGLGGLIVSYGNAFKTAQLMAGIVVAAAFGVIVIGVMNLLQRKIFPWVGGQRGVS
jgi:ABC-type nitrate/sulfonate/bicarbonate transport system permease component